MPIFSFYDKKKGKNLFIAYILIGFVALLPIGAMASRNGGGVNDAFNKAFNKDNDCTNTNPCCYTSDFNPSAPEKSGPDYQACLDSTNIELRVAEKLCVQSTIAGKNPSMEGDCHNNIPMLTNEDWYHVIFKANKHTLFGKPIPLPKGDRFCTVHEGKNNCPDAEDQASKQKNLIGINAAVTAAFESNAKSALAKSESGMNPNIASNSNFTVPEEFKSGTFADQKSNFFGMDEKSELDSTVYKAKASSEIKKQAALDLIKLGTSLMEHEQKIRAMQAPAAPSIADMARDKASIVATATQNYQKQLQVFQQGQQAQLQQIAQLKKSLEEEIKQAGVDSKNLEKQALELKKSAESLAGGEQNTSTNAPNLAAKEPSSETPTAAPTAATPATATDPNAANEWAGLIKSSADGAKLIADASKKINDDANKAKDDTPHSVAGGGGEGQSGIGNKTNGPSGAAADKNASGASQEDKNNEVAKNTDNKSSTGASKEDKPLKDAVRESIATNAPAGGEFKNPLSTTGESMAPAVSAGDSSGVGASAGGGGQSPQYGGSNTEIGALDGESRGGSMKGFNPKLAGMDLYIPNAKDMMESFLGMVVKNDDPKSAAEYDNKLLGNNGAGVKNTQANRAPASTEKTQEENLMNISIFQRISEKIVKNYKSGNILGPVVDYEKRR